MADEMVLTPVAEDSPCGDDLRWDPDFTALEQAFDLATAGDVDVVEGESDGGPDTGLQDIVAAARRLCGRTKDMRVLAILAEASWRHGGLAAFADAFTDLVTVAETWGDPDAGFHPRADEEDGDLGERNAPLTKLVGRIPVLVDVVGWRNPPTPAQQAEARVALAEVFDAWSARLEPAFGRDLASCREAWQAIRKLVGEAAAPPTDSADDGDATVGDVVASATPAQMDAWDSLDHTLQLMTMQNGHSPAIPVLRLLGMWRNANIIEIVESMSESGVTLEQLLAAVKSRLDAG
ncbi:MAG: hypothetical protein F4Y86_09095 [Gammaproteobacteria bacterium]|nr:hypothetical protein [Gammaproteobacteria bacterium]MYB39558.1 hypothetical protein [Gammaproteobacteria bacterium]